MDKIFSLKKDCEPCEKRIIFCGDKAYHEYFFKKGHGIDCFCRLNLTADNLDKLYQIAKLNRKITKEYEKDGMSKQLNSYMAEQERLYEEFYNEFYNPYGLDYEYMDEWENIGFVFGDYDYSYELVHYKDGWGIACRISYYQDDDEPYVEMDSADIIDNECH